MKVVLAALPLFSVVLGGSAHFSSASAKLSDIEKCLTEFGSLSRTHVSTSTSTTTVQQADVNVAVTVRPTHTVTPLVKTKTMTYTHSGHITQSVADDAVTSTVTVTSTDMFKNYTTIYQVATVSVTSTITTTVPTPSGFLPIANTTSSYPVAQNNLTMSGTMKSSASHKYPVQSLSHTSASASASASAGVSASASASLAARDGKGHSQGKSFANVVSCLKSVLVQKTKTHTKTGEPTTVTIPASTTTVTVTVSASDSASVAASDSASISASASVSASESASASASASASLDARGIFNHHHGNGDAVTTKTVVTSVTVPATVITYSRTVTAQVSTTVTSYAACATNNQLGPYLVNGNAIIGVSSVEVNASHKLSTATSATDCCEMCMKLGDCTASGFIAETRNFGFCYLYTTNTCAAQSDHQLTYNTFQGVVSKLAMTVSNGACGYVEKANKKH
ncbi:hypothetical protein MBLNU459_g2367t1 [Dothideomycetes sp. NU459]